MVNAGFHKGFQGGLRVDSTSAVSWLTKIFTETVINTWIFFLYDHLSDW